MTRAQHIIWTRAALIAGSIGVIELLCRVGVIKPLTMIAPSRMVLELARMIASGELAFACGGTPSRKWGPPSPSRSRLAARWGRWCMRSRACALRSIPLLASWYAVPFFVFYPLLVALFGLNALPLIVIGVIFAAPAMMVSTLSGLDRVPRVMHKVARVHRLSRVQEARLITLPSAAPHLFTGLKLAFAYSYIGIIAGEFILSGGGLGYGIAYAFESFENRTMYALVLFVLLVATGVNGALHMWDGRFARRRCGHDAAR